MDRDPSGYKRVGALTYLPQVLRELGADPEAILSHCGLARNALENRDAAIPFSKAALLLEQCVMSTGCPHITILLARNATLDSFGIVGTLARNAPTLGNALRDIATHHHRYVEGGVLYLLPMQDYSLFGYAVYQKGTAAGAAQVAGMVMAVVAKLIRDLTGCVPVEVMLSHETPQNPASFHRHYSAPIRFNAEAFGLVFSKEALATKIRGADAAIYDAARQSLYDYWPAGFPNIVSMIRRAIFPRILFGTPTVEEIADKLRLHPRALNRELHCHKTNFRGQVEQLRFELARQLLTNTTIPIIQISTAFGYAAPSVFTRSFRRWSGETPLEWRGGRSDAPNLVRQHEPEDA